MNSLYGQPTYGTMESEPATPNIESFSGRAVPALQSNQDGFDEEDLDGVTLVTDDDISSPSQCPLVTMLVLFLSIPLFAIVWSVYSAYSGTFYSKQYPFP